ncbi:MAG: hypothetical protein KDC12_15310 [Flavobacteriales bacterium]|nr:hypothetical protein [Flavobacteriales bacterium]
MYYGLYDSIQSASIQSSIVELALQYDMAQKDLEIAKTELAKSRQRQWFLLIIGGIVLLGGVLLWFFNKRIIQQRAKTAAVLEVKEEENKRISNLLWKELGQAVRDKKLVLPGVELPEQTIQGAIEAAKFLTNQYFNPYIQVSLVHAIKYLISTLEGHSGLTIHFDSNVEKLNKSYRQAVYRVVENLLVDTVSSQKEGNIYLTVMSSGGKMEIAVRGMSQHKQTMMFQSAEARVEQLKGKIAVHSSRDGGDEVLASIPMG